MTDHAVITQRVGLSVSAGRSCFVRCDGCYNHFGRSHEVLPTAKLLRFLTVAAGAGVGDVTFCGGDPLSRPDILPLLHQTRNLGFRIKLDTVGTALLDDAPTIFYGRGTAGRVDAGALAGLVDRVGIPLDGSTNAVVQAFRKGRHDLFDEQLRILELLGAVRANVCVNTVVHAGNIDDLPSIPAVIAGHPCVGLWQVFQFSPTGPHGSRNRRRFEISADDFERAVSRLEHELTRSGRAFRLEPKSNRDRRGRYLLIDSDGLAWMPAGRDDGGPDRALLGNIADPAADEILLTILSGEPSPAHRHDLRGSANGRGA